MRIAVFLLLFREIGGICFSGNMRQYAAINNIKCDTIATPMRHPTHLNRLLYVKSIHHCTGKKEKTYR